MMSSLAITVLFLAWALPGQDSWLSAVSEANRLQSAGQYSEAERVLLSALDEARRLAPDLGPVATTYHNLAGVYQDMGRCDAAVQAYQRSVALWEKVGDRGRVYLFRTANHLVGLYLQCGQIAEAERHHDALIEPSVGGCEGADVAEALTNLGSIEYQKGRHSAALAHYRQALSMRERLAGTTSLDIGILLNNLAFAELRTGDVESAVANSRRALALIEPMVGPADRLLVWTLLDRADLLVLARRPAEADPLYARALAAARAGIGEDHPLTAVALTHYAVLLKTTGRKKDAARLEARAREIRARVPPIRQTVDIRELELSLRE
jgi:tetratricopeptide (TPR) repeat protein